MQNVRLDEVDRAALDVLPISTDYPVGHMLTWHEHRRAQLLYAATGVMVVQTQHQTWTVPTRQAVLIPPRTPHQVQMLEVSTLSLYIEDAAVPWWPRQCTVVEVTPLLRELLRTAATFPLDYDVEGRAGSIVRLALTEIAELAPLPFSVHLPAAASLRQLCVDYLAAPDVAVTNAQWAARAHMSERTLDRAFRGATGLAPAAWRVRARLLAAVPMLQSATVSEVATALGYASAAAFSAAFGRALGTSPSRFR